MMIMMMMMMVMVMMVMMVMMMMMNNDDGGDDDDDGDGDGDGDGGGGGDDDDDDADDADEHLPRGITCIVQEAAKFVGNAVGHCQDCWKTTTGPNKRWRQWTPADHTCMVRIFSSRFTAGSYLSCFKPLLKMITDVLI